jgi:hypothetical protein
MNNNQKSGYYQDQGASNKNCELCFSVSLTNPDACPTYDDQPGNITQRQKDGFAWDQRRTEGEAWINTKNPRRFNSMAEIEAYRQNNGAKRDQAEMISAFHPAAMDQFMGICNLEQ